MTADEYRRRAEANRPAELDLLAREANRLAASGLKANDVAQALGLTPAAADALLRSGKYASGTDSCGHAHG